MSWMGSRSACRAASQCALRIGNQRGCGDDGFIVVSRLMTPRWFASASNSSNATMSKVAEAQQPTVAVSPQVSQTHTSAVLVPPQQVDGTKVVVKLEDEYPFEVAPVEVLKTEELRRALSSSEHADQAHFAPRIGVPKVAETEPASSASPNLGRGERQARSTPETRKNSVDKNETAKFAAIAATWYVFIYFRFSF